MQQSLKNSFPLQDAPYSYQIKYQKHFKKISKPVIQGIFIKIANQLYQKNKINYVIFKPDNHFQPSNSIYQQLVQIARIISQDDKNIMKQIQLQQCNGNNNYFNGIMNKVLRQYVLKQILSQNYQQIDIDNSIYKSIFGQTYFDKYKQLCQIILSKKIKQTKKNQEKNSKKIQFNNQFQKAVKLIKFYRYGIKIQKLQKISQMFKNKQDFILMENQKKQIFIGCKKYFQSQVLLSNYLCLHNNISIQTLSAMCQNMLFQVYSDIFEIQTLTKQKCFKIMPWMILKKTKKDQFRLSKQALVTHSIGYDNQELYSILKKHNDNKKQETNKQMSKKQNMNPSQQREQMFKNIGKIDDPIWNLILIIHYIITKSNNLSNKIKQYFKDQNQISQKNSNQLKKTLFNQIIKDEQINKHAKYLILFMNFFIQRLLYINQSIYIGCKQTKQKQKRQEDFKETIKKTYYLNFKIQLIQILKELCLESQNQAQKCQQIYNNQSGPQRRINTNLFYSYINLLEIFYLKRRLTFGGLTESKKKNLKSTLNKCLTQCSINDSLILKKINQGIESKTYQTILQKQQEYFLELIFKQFKQDNGLEKSFTPYVSYLIKILFNLNKKNYTAQFKYKILPKLQKIKGKKQLSEYQKSLIQESFNQILNFKQIQN